MVKSGIIRKLGKQTEPTILKANTDAIISRNVLKKNAAGVVSNRSNSRNPSMVKAPLQIGPATGKASNQRKTVVTPDVIYVGKR